MSHEPEAVGRDSPCRTGGLRALGGEGAQWVGPLWNREECRVRGGGLAWPWPARCATLGSPSFPGLAQDPSEPLAPSPHPTLIISKGSPY